MNNTYTEITEAHSEINWTSDTGKLYHYIKHGDEFERDNMSAENYFGKYSQMIFNEKNIVSTRHLQDDNAIIQKYVSTFGIRTHIGLILVNNKGERKIMTHFLEKIDSEKY